MATERHALSQRTTIVRGRKAVSALQPLLVALSRQTGQAGAMDWLDSFLYSPTSLKKEPHVVLIDQTGDPLRQSSANSLLGAVLIYEYRFAGLPTGIFATDDISGTQTVIATPESRYEVARLAAMQLMRKNAAIAFCSVDQDAVEVPVAADVTIRTEQRTRWVPTSLLLGDTVDSTLAQLGTKTRRNLRYYRRRAAMELGAYFVPHAELDREEFLALNQASTHPLSSEDASWRYGLLERSGRHSATLYSGMRSADGRWLSLIWGQRHDGLTKIYWQMNRAGVAQHSFSIAMRALLLEHEIGLGTTALSFIGGTQHSMSASCSAAPITDILAIRRRSARSWALRRFAKDLLPDANFLRGALQDENMAAA